MLCFIFFFIPQVLKLALSPSDSASICFSFPNLLSSFPDQTPYSSCFLSFETFSLFSEASLSRFPLTPSCSLLVPLMLWLSGSLSLSYAFLFLLRLVSLFLSHSHMLCALSNSLHSSLTPSVSLSSSRPPSNISHLRFLLFFLLGLRVPLLNGLLVSYTVSLLLKPKTTHFNFFPTCSLGLFDCGLAVGGELENTLFLASWVAEPWGFILSLPFPSYSMHFSALY